PRVNNRPPRLGILLLFFVLGQALERARLVHNSLEQPPDRRILQRAAVVPLRIRQNLLLALRLVNREVGGALQVADLDGAPRALIQQLDQLAVDFVNPAAPVVYRPLSPRVAKPLLAG